MNISFFDTLCLRVPAYSSRYYGINDDELIGLINDDTFMDALFVASPEFYSTCLKWRAGEVTDGKKVARIKSTLLKYHNRMCYRPTPFGLFSACSTVSWGNETDIIIDAAKTTYQVRPDTNFLAAVIEKLEHEFAGGLHYTLNTSIYKIGDEYRYYEYELNGGKRQYKINAVEVSDELEYLQQLLSNGASSLTALLAALCIYFESDEDEVAGYLDELIAIQFLVSTLQPCLTSPNTLNSLTDALNDVGNAATATAWHQLTNALNDLNSQLTHPLHRVNLRAQLQKAKQTADGTGVDYRPKELLQVDSYNYLKNNTVNSNIRSRLAKGLHILQLLNSQPDEDGWLKQIKKNINDKFANRPVLLTQLFDPDTGINQPASGSRISFGSKILDELNSFVRSQSSSSAPTADIVTRPIKAFFDNKLKQAVEKGAVVITITEEDIRYFETQGKTGELPATFPVIFKIINEPGARLLIESAGGATGTNLVGRFAKDNEQLLSLMQEIAAAEQQANPGAVIAAAVHLPQNRTGNVLQNPCVREYEIPYLAASSLPVQNQIFVKDIYVYLDGSRLRLYSSVLKKEIIPRIDNAHNFTADALPIYRLLGALQNEHKIRNLGIVCSINNYGIQFSPRVQYREIILQCAQWVFNIDDIRPIIDEKNMGNALGLFNKKCDKWCIPPLFLWAQGDQTLLVDRSDPALLQLFINEIRALEQITIKEFIGPDPACVKDDENYYYNHQLVAIAHCQNEVKQTIASKSVFEKNKLQRAFFPGSEWYYYKIYCSEFFSDKLLCSVLYPLCNEWKEKGIIDKWFFIRYRDPENHIRLRFHFAGPNFRQTITKDLLTALSVYINDGLVWKAQTDTYERELERYTARAYPVIENFFDLDSTYCMEILQDKEAYDNAAIPLLWLSIKKIDAVLSLFGFPMDTKLALATKSSKAFQEEFNISAVEKDIIHRYYHSFTSQLKESLEETDARPTGDGLADRILHSNRQNRVLFEANKHLFKDDAANPQIALSIIHMHFNRLFATDQRRFEMIGYMIISMYYNARLKFLNRKVPVS